MIRLTYASILILLFSSNAWAGFDDLKAPIEANTCRLANGYIMKGGGSSGSAGTIVNGKYETAKSKEDCTKQCKGEAKYRADGKPSEYGLKVACFFGKEKLYERVYR
jgi:hypothetical protein